MAKGRKPKPAHVREAEGNAGRRRLPKAPPPQGEAPASFEELFKLTPIGQQIWDALAPELTRLQFLRHSDRPTFARYCDTLARYWRVTRELDAFGTETYETVSEHVTIHRIHPKFMVQERLERRLTALEDRFGLSPLARQQIMLRLAGQPGLFPDTPRPEAAAGAPPAPLNPSPIGALNHGRPN